MPGIQLVCQRAEQGGLRGGLVYHNNLQVFNHKDTKTCRYIKAIYILICWLLGVKAHSKGRLNNNLSISKKKRELIDTLLNKYETLLNKQVDKYQKMIDEQSKCQYYCRFANNKFLCYTHRCLYFFTKKWNSIKVFVEHYKWRRG